MWLQEVLHEINFSESIAFNYIIAASLYWIHLLYIIVLNNSFSGGDINQPAVTLTRVTISGAESGAGVEQGSRITGTGVGIELVRAWAVIGVVSALSNAVSPNVVIRTKTTTRARIYEKTPSYFFLSDIKYYIAWFKICLDRNLCSPSGKNLCGLRFWVVNFLSTALNAFTAILMSFLQYFLR